MQRPLTTPLLQTLLCAALSTHCAHTNPPPTYTPLPSPAFPSIAIHLGHSPAFQAQHTQLQNFLFRSSPPYVRDFTSLLFPDFGYIEEAFFFRAQAGPDDPLHTCPNTLTTTPQTLNTALTNTLHTLLPTYNISATTTHDPQRADILLTGSVFCTRSGLSFAWQLTHTSSQRVLAADLRPLSTTTPLDTALHSLFHHLLPQPTIASHIRHYPALLPKPAQSPHPVK